MNDAFNADLAEVMQVEPAAITADYALDGDGLWDSMAIVSALALIDEHFDKTVDSARLGECDTVGEIYRLIESS